MITNNPFSKALTIVMVLCLVCWASACSEDEPPLPDNLVSFAASAVGIADTESEATININLSRAVAVATILELTYTADGVVYGEDFTTNPAATGNTLSVTIPANATTASFTVIRNEEAFLEGTESVGFEITAVQSTEEVLIGTVGTTTLSFSAIVSEGSQLTLQGIAGSESGSSAANSVFVNLRSNTQTPVLRTSWDLAFYNGEDFRVMINNTSGASAMVIDETDLNAVDTEDADTDALTIPLGTPGEASFAMIDDVSGDLDNTVIASISATASDNKVYLINRVGGSFTSVVTAENLIKIRVIRNGNGGYTLQYAKIGESTFRTLEVAKEGAANFSYVSFGEDGSTATEASVEPASWDIEWSWSVYVGGTGEDAYPYGFSDVVFVNHLGDIKAAEVLTSTVTYEAYSETNIASTTFASERNVIGSTWRATTGTPGVFTDRFYVIEDAAGNVYKLKFVSFHPNDGGTRGKPVIEYALVKKSQ